MTLCVLLRQLHCTVVGPSAAAVRAQSPGDPMGELKGRYPKASRQRLRKSHKPWEGQNRGSS